MNKYTERLYNGIWKENPIFVQMLGLCPTLAVTTSAMNGLGMGLSSTVVLVAANFIISLMRSIIPGRVRLPGEIVVVASLVTLVDMLMEGFRPELYSALGIYIPLIVVNCVILGRAEAFAMKNKPIISAFDGAGMGLGFTFALVCIGAVRELLGAGSIFGVGGAVIFVITIASVVASLIYQFVLNPLGLDYLKTIVFILVIAALVQIVEMFLKKCMVSLYNALGVFLPLITTNCAVLGVALTNVQNGYSFVQSVVNGVATAVGYTVSIVLLAGIRERIEGNDIPYNFQGSPIVLVTAGLMAIAFFGFSGLL